jgi:MFS family permease
MRKLQSAAVVVGAAAISRPKFLVNPVFGLFWTGQTISTLGAQVTAFAVPLLAALTLHANAFEMGLLRAAEFVPFLIFTLPAGIWADLGIRRNLMISTNLVRGVFITVVPILVFAGWMRLELLYVVMFVMGALKVIFEMAYQTYVPAIVKRRELINANSKIMMSYALGQSVGPGFGGIMVELLGAPLAVLTDASTYFMSAFCLLQIKHREEKVRPESGGMIAQIIEGFRYVAAHKTIRPLLTLLTVNNFFMNAIMAVLVLYATGDLGFRPGVFGMIVSIGGCGAVLGAFGAERLGRWLGPGPFTILASGSTAVAAFCFPLVRSCDNVGLLGLAVAYFILSAGSSSVTVFAWTIRQTLTPVEMLGKMNGAFRFVVTGIMPFGAVFGGWLAQFCGIRYTLLISAVGLLVTAVVISRTRLWSLTDLSAEQIER